MEILFGLVKRFPFTHSPTHTFWGHAIKIQTLTLTHIFIRIACKIRDCCIGTTHGDRHYQAGNAVIWLSIYVSNVPKTSYMFDKGTAIWSGQYEEEVYREYHFKVILICELFLVKFQAIHSFTCKLCSLPFTISCERTRLIVCCGWKKSSNFVHRIRTHSHTHLYLLITPM